MDVEVDREPWEVLEALLRSDDTDGLKAYLDSLSAGETARAISRLQEGGQARLLTVLPPEDVARLLKELSDQLAAEVIENLAPAEAAAIVNEMPSDEQVDVLTELEPQQAEAILREMEPAEAEDVRRLRRHAADTAGGLMLTEYLVYPDTATLSEVIDDVREHRARYARYDIQYAYVVDAGGRLVGVLRLRDLVLSGRETAVADLMIRNPLHVRVDTALEGLRHFFDRHPFFGAPVVDPEGRLVGVVRRAAVEEALGARADSVFLKFSGIVGGEEMRTMPLFQRSFRRLSWLSINIVLNVIAASVIALYQDTLVAVIALAVFLPIISDMSGCSGNQAVAVSLRELALGLVRPYEVLRVVLKEAGVGLTNGLALGLMLGGVAWAWKGKPWLGVVVGGALALNTLVAVLIGGALPLVLRRLKMDPALASGPILTTVTDMCGFFLALSFANAVLPRLVF